MRFLYPWLLLAIPPVIVAGLAASMILSRRARRLALLANAEVLRRAGFARAGAAGFAERLRTWLLTCGLVLLALAAARPQWGRSDFKVASRGASLLIALDVSRSMLAADVHPNRLERAKADILDLIGDLRGDRAGLLAFRGKGVMLCPLTADYAFLRQAIDGVSVDSAPRGETDIADAIEKCLEALATSAEDNCAIVLISDGEDLAGRAAKAAAKAAARNIPIFTVGIGDPAGADVPAADGGGTMKFGGRAVKSRLTEQTLREIATSTGGAYIPLATSGTASTTLGAIYREHLAKMARREFDETLENRFVERYQLFLVPALLLILAAGMLSQGRLARMRRGAARAAAVVMVLAFQSLAGEPQPEQPAAEAGQATEEVQSMRDARTRYNSALEAYRVGDSAGAAELLLPISIRGDIPEAVELFGAAQFANAAVQEAVTNDAERLRLLEDSARAFQLAMASGGRADSQRVARNLSRALAPVAALREKMRNGEIAAKYGNIPPDQLLSRILQAQRGISASAREAASKTDAAERIAAFEALVPAQGEIRDMGQRVAEIFDGAIPSITNQEAVASIKALLEAAGRGNADTADALENIDAAAADSSDALAMSYFQLWKPVAEPPAYVDESILCETNAVVSPDTPRWPAAPDAAVSLDLMSAFAQTFPGWAEEYIKNQAQEAQQSGSTNALSFTEENVEKIMQLLEPLLFILKDSAQFDGAPKEKAAAANEALPLLEQIRDLLPKQNNGQSQNQQNQQDQNQQENQDGKQNQDSQQQNQQAQSKPQGDDEKQKPEERGKEEKDVPEDVEEALRRAIQREREHEAEKQKLRREAPIPANTRDW